MYIAFGILLGFAIVGSAEARLRKLFRPHEASLACLQMDLARVERKLDDLLRHGGLSGHRPDNEISGKAEGSAQ
jgi:hypothetical protein